MKIYTTYVTRHIKNGEVVEFVVKYNPPCPPIQVYRVEKNGLIRILPDRTEIKMRPTGLELNFVSKSKKELEEMYPNMQVEDPKLFNLEDYLKNPRGEYDIL